MYFRVVDPIRDRITSDHGWVLSWNYLALTIVDDPAMVRYGEAYPATDETLEYALDAARSYRTVHVIRGSAFYTTVGGKRYMTARGAVARSLTKMSDRLVKLDTTTVAHPVSLAKRENGSRTRTPSLVTVETFKEVYPANPGNLEHTGTS